ncbi:MAG: PP2C family protein-serine/threonine phosphatase [Gemmatimonadota bacterium]
MADPSGAPEPLPPARRGGVADGPAADRLPGTLAELAATTGLRFRLVLDDGERERVLHDSLGADEAEVEAAEVWDLEDGAELRASFAPATRREEGALRRLLAAFAPALVRLERELRFFNRELAARYGEVELLTSAAETLGAGLVLDRGVQTLLGDLAEVMDATAAELWTVEEDEPRLVRYGSSEREASRAVVDLELNRGPLAAACRDLSTRAVSADRRDELIVPVRRAAAHGLTGALGVLRVCRPRGRGFGPADRKLVAAIAGQVGAAFENRRLSDESLERERMMVELELAHHLQLKLLPEVSDFADCADIAARCEPAESVGGDFYHLFRLGGGRVGVMLGDVSSHGYSAGLIMALTMSAASLVVRERDRPGAVLRGIHQELVRKLESTQMYMTLCYAVLDPEGSRLRYANAGHPHAFRIGAERADRLEALNPPLGLAEFGVYEERGLAWEPDRDTLLMFTDGLSETLQADRIWSDDLILETVRRHLSDPAADVVNDLFALASADGPPPVDDRTALVLK